MQRWNHQGQDGRQGAEGQEIEQPEGRHSPHLVGEPDRYGLVESLVLRPLRQMIDGPRMDGVPVARESKVWSSTHPPSPSSWLHGLSPAQRPVQ